MAGFAIAISAYNGRRAFRASSALYPLIGKACDGPIGTIVDAFMVMSLVIVGTNMGLSVIQLNAGLNSLIGGANGVNMELVIIAVYLVMTIYFACSGVHGAMGALSNVNALMYVAVILFVLFCGGANRLLGLYSTTVSNFIMQYIPLVGFADPIQQTG